jgi:hypothetical protein
MWSLVVRKPELTVEDRVIGVVGFCVEVVVPVLIVDREDEARFIADPGQPPASGQGGSTSGCRLS